MKYYNYSNSHAKTLLSTVLTLFIETGEESSSAIASQQNARTSMHRMATTEGVPMPTLYMPSHGSSHVNSQTNIGNSTGSISMGNSGASDNKRGRMGVIELLLYNMSSTLASVAAGYDVRLSNVMPVHPKLHPRYV